MLVNLPIELISMILSNLDLENILHIRLTTTFLKNIADSSNTYITINGELIKLKDIIRKKIVCAIIADRSVPYSEFIEKQPINMLKDTNNTIKETLVGLQCITNYVCVIYSDNYSEENFIELNQEQDEIFNDIFFEEEKFGYLLHNDKILLILWEISPDENKQYGFTIVDKYDSKIIYNGYCESLKPIYAYHHPYFAIYCGDIVVMNVEDNSIVTYSFKYPDIYIMEGIFLDGYSDNIIGLILSIDFECDTYMFWDIKNNNKISELTDYKL
mgnify:CR=1 FL=1